MKKKAVPLFIFMCITLIMILLTGLYFYFPDETPTYILKDHNGKIAVFENGSNTPVEILDTDTASLPENDKNALKTGIRAASREELYRLIEDFSG